MVSRSTSKAVGYCQSQPSLTLFFRFSPRRRTAQSLPVATEGASYLPAPIAQPSLGGGAGPFQVSSLARSSNYDFGQNGVTQTTSFVAPGPSYASVNRAAGSYNTMTGGTVTANDGRDTAVTTLPGLTGGIATTQTPVASGNAAMGRADAMGWKLMVGPPVAASFAAIIGAALLL